MDSNVIILYFFTYSIIGWCCEVVYCSIPQKKFVNRGFLAGPYCPIYGFGALLILTILDPFFNNPLIVFILGVLVTSVLEYITGWAMEKMFHAKWWDYSKKPLNIHGRVCMQNSLIFGILGLILIYFVHPVVSDFIMHCPAELQHIIATVLSIAMFVDLAISLVETQKFTARLQEVSRQAEAFSEEIKHRKAKTEDGLRLEIDNLSMRNALRRQNISNNLDEFASRIFDSNTTKIKLHKRLANAFPTLKLPNDPDALKFYSDSLKQWLKDKRKSSSKAK